MNYKQGDRGSVVAAIQKIVGAYPDGIWGKITTECLKAWQREHGLTADGIAGPRTLAAMGISAMTAKSDPYPQVICNNSVGLKKSRRRIDYLVVHCTATREGQDMTVEEIRKSHLKRGFSDVGYHYIVYRDGTLHLGRNVDIAGAHVEGHNSNTIGIVYVGGLENDPKKEYKELKAKDTRTDAQKAALMSLLIDLKKLYPQAKIRGHRDFSPDKNHNGTIEPSEWIKDCPSFDAKAVYSKI